MNTSLPIANGKYTLETYTNSNGKPCLKITTQRGKVVCNFYYKTEAERDTAAVKNGEFLEKLEADKDEYRAGAKSRKATAATSIEVGAILYTSWGYEQTNVSFYQVIEANGQKVIAREIYRELTNEGGYGSMAGRVAPLKDEFRNEKTFRVGFTNHGGFTIDGQTAYQHKSGESHYCSWYA